MQKFSRRCRLCRREAKASRVRPAQARELANAFAGAHLAHMVEDKPTWDPCRCAGCGTLLLWDWLCPEHPNAERVRWYPALAEKYGVVVGALAAGQSVTYAPIEKAIFDRAYGLAKAWGMRKDVWLREEVTVS